MDKKMIEQILRGGNVRNIIADSSRAPKKKRFFEEDETEYGTETYDDEAPIEPEDVVAPEDINAEDVDIICPECGEGVLDCVIDVDDYGYFKCSNCACKFELSKVEEPTEVPADEPEETEEPEESEEPEEETEEEEKEESVEDLEEACNRKRKTK